MDGEVDTVGFWRLMQSLLLIPSEQTKVLEVAWTLVREVVFYGLFGLAILSRRLALVGMAVFASFGLTCVPMWAEPLCFRGFPYYDLQFVLGIGAAWITLHRPMPYPRMLIALGSAAFITAGGAEKAGYLLQQDYGGRLAYGIASAVTIVGLAQAERAGRLQISPALSLLGAASYSIYLVHAPMVSYTAKILSMAGLMTWLPGWLAMTIVVFAVVTAGILFHSCIERPLAYAAQRLMTRGHRPNASLSSTIRY